MYASRLPDMPLSKFVFNPGIVVDATRYTAEGSWVDGDKVRFRLGMPEKIGGWQVYSKNAYTGVCRGLHQWYDLMGNRYIAAGTTVKLYIENSQTLVDVTPIRKTTATMTPNPFLPNGGGSSLIKVTDTAHGALAGDLSTAAAG